MNKLFWGCLALCFTFMIQGCKQNMDLNPQDYFSGQQLTLAKAIEDGKVEDVEKLASETDLNKPGQHDMTLLFWSIMNAINDKKNARTFEGYYRSREGRSRSAPAAPGG